MWLPSIGSLPTAYSTSVSIPHRPLGEYLSHLGLAAGTLVLFDQRTQAPSIEERCARDNVEHDGIFETV